MYSSDELNERIGYLRKLSSYNVAELFSELEEAIQAYLVRDSEFELQVNKTLDKVIADAFHHNLIYEHQELIEPWQSSRGEPPTGYSDVAELFKGNEVFEEIMSIADRDFKAAFYQKDDDGSTTPQYGNTYLENWIETLAAAVVDEMAGLKAIMQYCANQSYSVEFAILFEEHGKATNRKSVKSYAKEIFVTKGYGWLIETFNLNVYRPSYLAELEEEND